jgi:hypothetical protein
MKRVESVKAFIERLVALRPAERLQAWLALSENGPKKLARSLLEKVYGEMLLEQSAQKLSRRVLKRGKPTRAA